jgi:hypothetical protein
LANDVRAVGRMAFHLRVLLVGQRGGLREDRVRDAELADVVEESRV